MKNKTHTIWSNEIKMEDWKDYIDERNAERAEDEEPPLTDERAYQEVQDMNDIYLDDERCNLDIQIPGVIVIFADLGLWNGRHQGFKCLHTWNIKELFYSDCDYCTWYCDRYDFKFRGVHHDGTNHYTYRELREEWYLDILVDLSYSGKLTPAHITRYTRSLRPYIQKVYGF